MRVSLKWNWWYFRRRRLAAGCAALLLATLIAVTHFSAKADDTRSAGTGPKVNAPAASPAPRTDPSVELTDAQLKSIKIGVAAEHGFPQERTAVGSIDFNENLAVQVFSPYQGKIIRAYAEVGDQVKKGQTLFTIESPDLIQADSNLIAAAGLLGSDDARPARAKQLYEVQGIAEKDLQQAISDQQTAEGALKKRDRTRISENYSANRRPKSKRSSRIARSIPSSWSRALSPAKITARVAQPGLLVQPGNAHPYIVADVVTVWMMLANVSRRATCNTSTSGQEVGVSTMAYPEPAVRRQDHGPRGRAWIRICMWSWSGRRSKIRGASSSPECSRTSSSASAIR